MTALRFTLADVERANAAWGCNCGPTALAAICGLTLDEVRAHMPDFPGYTNPTLMKRALNSVGKPWLIDGKDPSWPLYGLARIQWEGPWTQPGVPMAARYRQTHWVGAWTTDRPHNRVGVWDVNALANGSGWCALADWTATIVPFITADIKRASGGWHITHAIEIDRPTTNGAAHG